ncbi:magnesium transporter CorA family protein [Klebsiella aerogenes]|uniref:magnesium transporter CorA family protein n=1 Tax=Klebsiella aerogenes TaxID=548 RepID=UPI002FF55483
MIHYYNIENNRLTKQSGDCQPCIIITDDFQQEEIESVAVKLNIPYASMMKSLSNTERSRVDLKPDYVFVVVNYPEESERKSFNTAPLCLFITRQVMFIVCRQRSILSSCYVTASGLSLNPGNVLLSLILSVSERFKIKTKGIISDFEKTEERVLESTKNDDVIKIMDMRRSLIFFSMALHANDLVIARLISIIRSGKNALLSEDIIDDELVDDVYTESKQAIEIVSTYSKVIMDMMNTVTSMVSNNQNKFLKLLSVLTLQLTIPMLFSSLWGMNVKVPFEGQSSGFIMVVSLSFILTLIISVILRSKKMFS